MATVNGVLILDKPEGFSSNQALQKAKRIFSAKKAGHTGSLDVLASGLLPICFGEATKFAKYLLSADKSYRVTAKLGQRTTTCDREGEVVEEKAVNVTQSQVEKVLKDFLGETQQVPSMFSALKHKGQPLYKLARKGIEVERKPRTIFIHDLTLLDFQKDTFSLDVVCSKGTYIRNLIDDVGQALGCGAHVLSLRRLSAGSFKAEQMLTLDKLATIREQQGIDALYQRLLPIDTLLNNIPAYAADEKQVKRLKHGQKISPNDHMAPAESLFRLYVDEQFVGVVETDAHRVLKPVRMLVS